MLANSISKIEYPTLIVPKDFIFGCISPNVEVKKVLDTPVGFSFKKMIASCKGISMIKDISPDIIHITVSYPLTNLILGLFSKCPLVLTVHDPIPHRGEIKNNWRTFLANMSDRLIFDRSDKIIVHSDVLKKELIKRNISEDKICIIPHGDYSFFTKYKKNIEPTKNNILFFGRIIDYKGLEYLIQSIPKIAKEIPDIKLIIAGKGDISKYQSLIDKNASHIKVYNEYITDDMVAGLFESTELLVLPYIGASQSGPLHIAYSFKRPVIATNVGALPEVIEDGKTGLIIPPKDIDALVGAIIKLLKNDNLRKDMGDNAYMKMKKEMSWDIIADKTIKVYKDVIQLNNNK